MRLPLLSSGFTISPSLAAQTAASASNVSTRISSRQSQAQQSPLVAPQLYGTPQQNAFPIVGSASRRSLTITPAGRSSLLTLDPRSAQEQEDYAQATQGLGGLPLGLEIFSDTAQLQQFQDVPLVPPNAAAAAAAAAVAAAMAAAAQSSLPAVPTSAQDKPQQPANNSHPVKAGGKLHSRGSKSTATPAAQSQTAQPQQQASTSAQPQASTEGLPVELSSLADAALPLALPPPGSISPSLLDNSKLDKLVATLGRSRGTWRRALMLYEWLKASGHTMDDRFCTTLIRVCADHGDAVSALSVYEWMRAPRAAGGAALRPTTYTYTAAMRAALGASMLERAMQVWGDSQAAGLVPDCRLCITYIEVATKLDMTEQALNMYRQMRDAPSGSPMAPTVHAYTAAMRAATEGGRWVEALEIWDDMQRAGCQPTGHAYAAAITACAAGADWQRAVALFESMTSHAGIRPDVVSCTALISALGAAAQADKAEAVVMWMLTTGLKPNVRTYTALLGAMGAAKRWVRAVELLFMMQRPEYGSVTPNAYTYSALLKSLGEHGQWQLAEALFSLIESQVLAGGNAAGTLASGPTPPVVGDAHRTSRAQAKPDASAPPSIPSEAKAQALAPHTQGSQQQPEVMSAHQQHLLAVALSAEARQNRGPGAGPSPTPVSPVLPADSIPTGPPQQLPQPVLTQGHGGSSSSSASSSQEGSRRSSISWSRPSQLNGLQLELHQQPKESQPQPASSSSSRSSSISTRTTYASGHASPAAPPAGNGFSLFSGGTASQSGPAGRADTASTAQSTPRSAHNSSSPAHAPVVNEVVCGSLMLAYERSGKWADAVNVLNRAKALGVQPNAVMYNIAISAAGKAGQLALAQSLFNSATARDVVTYESLIAAYGIAGMPDQAELVYTQMVEQGMRRSDYTYSSLVAAYSLAGDMEGALRVRRRMRQAGCPPSVHVFNALLAACERVHAFEVALELLQAMRREGVEPNAVTQQLMSRLGQQGVQSVETQQVAAAALSAVFAAAGGMLMRVGMF